MGEFFKGWRRKAGVVSLVMALALAGMWLRTRFALDHVHFSVGNRLHVVNSAFGLLTWSSVDAAYYPLGWGTTDMAAVGSNTSPSKNTEEWLSRHQKLNPRFWEVPHSSLVLPLTLLSAYLILWKPRKVGAGQKLEPSKSETTQPSLKDFRGK